MVTSVQLLSLGTNSIIRSDMETGIEYDIFHRVISLREFVRSIDMAESKKLDLTEGQLA